MECIFCGTAPSLRGRYPASSLIWAAPTSIGARPEVMTSPWLAGFAPTTGANPRNGSPGYLGLSLRARSLQSPRPSRRVQTLIASSPIAGFTVSGWLAARQMCNEAESSSRKLGPALLLSEGNHPSSLRASSARCRNVSRALLPPRVEAQLNGE